MRNSAEVTMSTVNPLARAAAIALLALAGVVAAAPPAAAADSAESLYGKALGRERELRDPGSRATLAQLRWTIDRYERLVRAYPASGYADNALWQAGNLALLTFERFGQAADRKTAARLLTHLRDGYPASPFRGRATEELARMAGEPSSRPAAAAAASPVESPARAADPEVEPAPPSPAAPVATAGGPAASATIKEIRRTALPDGVRVTIELDSESTYRYERLEHPRRVFFDLRRTKVSAALQDAVLRFDDTDVVREIRLGRHPNSTTRIVMDMEAVDSCTVFTLYNPFRLVVDFKRDASATRLAASPPSVPSPVPGGVPARLPGPVPLDVARAGAPADPKASVEARTPPAAKEPVPLLSRPAAANTPGSPAVPAANSNGQFSLARQLGLGVSRIVLDAGHGGHDPGARANGLTEAELVLDVTLRLRDLLQKQPGMEVTLTRDSDEFVPLEERTAMANRQGADLFLSIHANASRNVKARGVETYFLNFASNPEAEAVAARENSASGRTMHSLPEIVRAIALNNKIDESRDFAETVQRSMVRRLSTRNKLLRDLGVKQAPFVVLIGAGMPSVLAEISFVTNKQEGALLKTPAYRQQIAESLFEAVVRYQRSLKGVRAVASARDDE